jgi:DNA (cytosine-5)-methyltransferase 1
MRILNLYAGIGGNRKFWGDEHQVTSVEYDADIANVYKSFFPQDELVVTDAHAYLQDNYSAFDFIWSSPPCQSHSSIRFNRAVKYLGSKPIYPDLRLYEEIMFLQSYFEGLWVVENVVPYYKPLIPAQKINRHLYWANFEISDLPLEPENIRSIQIPELQKLHGFDLSGHKLKNKRQVLRNCVSPKVGLHILKIAEGVIDAHRRPS